MKVLIVSDTHGHDENLERAVMMETPFDMLVHCGDVEGREIFIEALVDCPCCIVAGNNDFSQTFREKRRLISMEIRYWLRTDIIMAFLWIFQELLKKQNPETVMLCSSDTRTSP